MKNENFALESSLGANYLTVRLQDMAQLDEIAVNVINEDCPKFLIPFRIVNVNDSSFLKYKLVNTIALEYCNTTVRKAEFVRMYLGLLTPFVKGNDWFLDYHNFCIDRQYVFLDKMTETVYFIYIPEVSYRNTENEILQFFRDAFIRMTITDDADFQVRIFRYFARKDITLEELYLLFQEENKKINNGGQSVPQKVPAAFTPPYERNKTAERDIQSRLNIQPKENQVKQEEAGLKSEDVELSTDASEDEVMQALFGEKKNKKKSRDKKKSLTFFGKKKDTISEKKPESLKGKTGGEGNTRDQKVSSVLPFVSEFAGNREEDKTEISSEYGQIAERSCLELIDSPIPGAVPRINLDFSADFITIGRRSSAEVQPDVPFGKEFTRMGRRHARIERRGNRYYVIDLGSANHTFLNGQMLVPNQPYELTDGGELSFTDSKPVRYRIHL